MRGSCNVQLFLLATGGCDRRYLVARPVALENTTPPVYQLIGTAAMYSTKGSNNHGSGKFAGNERRASEIDGARIPLAALAHVARPSSLHPGGVNLSSADGHSRFVSDSIDYRTY